SVSGSDGHSRSCALLPGRPRTRRPWLLGSLYSSSQRRPRPLGIRRLWLPRLPRGPADHAAMRAAPHLRPRPTRTWGKMPRDIMKAGPRPERDLRIMAVIVIVTVLGAVGCLRRPLLSFDLAVPPQVLVVGTQ